MKPLIVPPAAQRDEDSIQMLSAWIAEKGLHCSLNIGMWEDNGKNEAPAWGLLLADTIQHIANALEERYGYGQTHSIELMLQVIHSELKFPSSEIEGNFHPGHH